MFLSCYMICVIFTECRQDDKKRMCRQNMGPDLEYLRNKAYVHSGKKHLSPAHARACDARYTPSPSTHQPSPVTCTPQGLRRQVYTPPSTLHPPTLTCHLCLPELEMLGINLHSTTLFFQSNLVSIAVLCTTTEYPSLFLSFWADKYLL